MFSMFCLQMPFSSRRLPCGAMVMSHGSMDCLSIEESRGDVLFVPQSGELQTDLGLR